MKVLRYVEMRLWFGDKDQTKDEPDEIVGFLQPTLGETADFAAGVVRAHFDGECMCQELQGNAAADAEALFQDIQKGFEGGRPKP